MEYLEKTQGWKEEEFDVVLQYMRTVLLKRMLTFQLPCRGCRLTMRALPSRWRLADIYHAKLTLATAESHTREPGHYVTAQTATPEAQCH